jgi:hypothetical protein
VTPGRQATLAAAASRILPSQHGPGATEANVAGFLEDTLGQPYFRALLPWFEGHLDALEEKARERFDLGFSECRDRERDELLRALQKSPDPMTREFLLTLVRLTLEGLLGDPAHGGNREQVGWRWIGYRPQTTQSGACAREEDDQ